MERRHRHLAGASEYDSNLGRPARYLGAGHRNQDVVRAPVWMTVGVLLFGLALGLAMVLDDERQRPFERGGNPRNVRVKAAAFAFGVIDAEEKQVVALFCFVLDRFFQRLVGIAYLNFDRRRRLVVFLDRRGLLLGGGFDDFGAATLLGHHDLDVVL